MSRSTRVRLGRILSASNSLLTGLSGTKPQRWKCVRDGWSKAIVLIIALKMPATTQRTRYPLKRKQAFCSLWKSAAKQRPKRRRTTDSLGRSLAASDLQRSPLNPRPLKDHWQAYQRQQQACHREVFLQFQHQTFRIHGSQRQRWRCEQLGWKKRKQQHGRNNNQWYLHTSSCLSHRHHPYLGEHAILLSQKDLSDKEQTLINVPMDQNVATSNISKIVKASKSVEAIKTLTTQKTSFWKKNMREEQLFLLASLFLRRSQGWEKAVVAANYFVMQDFSKSLCVTTWFHVWQG